MSIDENGKIALKYFSRVTSTNTKFILIIKGEKSTSVELNTHLA